MNFYQTKHEKNPGLDCNHGPNRGYEHDQGKRSNHNDCLAPIGILHHQKWIEKDDRHEAVQ